MYTTLALSLLLVVALHGPHEARTTLSNGAVAAEVGAVSDSTREHWMRKAIQALPDLISPWPFEAFGTAVVNHTSDSELGELVCIGANALRSTGNPTLHGEVAAIDNCTAILTDPEGPYKLTPTEALAAYKDLTLYTTAEPCPMCATAIRYAGFKECVYATGIDTLIKYGWLQLDISSKEVFERSTRLHSRTRLLGGVLEHETNQYFAWQFRKDATCPVGCERESNGAQCLPVQNAAHQEL